MNFARFKINPERKIQNDTSFLKSVLNAKDADSFRLIEQFDNNNGGGQRKYQQYYKGIKVEHSEYVITSKNNIIETINGDFKRIDIPIKSPTISEQKALFIALDFIKASKYQWEDELSENFFKTRTKNPEATLYPKGELVIAKDYLRGSKNFKLAWKFSILSLIPNDERLVYIDAFNGEILGNATLILTENTIGTAQTQYSGIRGITCDTYSSGFRLYENRNTTLNTDVNINTKNCLSQPNYTNAVDFTNSNSNWMDGSWASIDQNRVALDAHWGQEMAIDYWSTVHGRNSLNNQGLDIIGYVHYFNPQQSNVWPNNAAWSPIHEVMMYGDGDGIFFNPFTTLDVIGHEMGHGINKFTSNLGSVLRNEESDALNEGFSDIWGAAVEYWAAPNKETWLMGEEIFAVPIANCIRNLRNPDTLFS